MFRMMTNGYSKEIEEYTNRINIINYEITELEKQKEDRKQVDEILKKYNGSFLIEEFDIKNKSFTKKVSIIFDYSDEYMLKSTRSKSDRHTLKSSLFKLI